MKIKLSDILICGFALFAIFFGAGNLIFPPYLGVISGNQWSTAALAFILSDPMLPVLGVIVTAFLGGQAEDLGKRVSPRFAILIGSIAILLIGPFFSVPRTGATTHEVFVQTFIPSAPQWITSLVFFGLTLYLALNPSRVIDAIGKYLTPGLILILILVFVAALINPPGPMLANQQADLFPMAYREGYQTMDALGASLMTGIVITDLKRRGYTDQKTQLRATIWVGLVAMVLLAIVYASLTYAGATVSSFYTAESDRTHIFVGMINHLLGGWGNFAMGIVVSLACLTTSVGLTSTCGNFFQSISKGKWSYRKIVILTVFVEFVISLLGVNAIINVAVPVLTAIYPVMIILIFLSIFDKWLTFDWTYLGGLVGALAIGLIQAVHLFSKMQGGKFLASLADWTYHLPLNQYGFEWLIPSLLLAGIFTVLQWGLRIDNHASL